MLLKRKNNKKELFPVKKFLNKFSFIFETVLFPACLTVIVVVPVLLLSKKDLVSIYLPISLVFLTFMSYAYWKILDLQRAITRCQNCYLGFISDDLKGVASKIDTILNYSDEGREDITKEVWEIIDFEDAHKFADAIKVRETLSIPTFILNCIIQEARISNDRDTVISILKPKKGEKQNE